MQAGASVPVVQRVLRHRDPRLTVNVYGHLAPDFSHREVDRPQFWSGEPPQLGEPIGLLHPCCHRELLHSRRAKPWKKALRLRLLG
jgi:hypothetical protein